MPETEGPASKQENEGTPYPWQRVSPVAIIYFLFDSLRQAANLWPGLVAVLAGGEQFRAAFLSYGVPGLLAVFVCSVFLHFWFFRFRVDEGSIQLHSGILNRKKLTLYFERVQQADIAEPFYFRPFGLATLGLESAGSGQQEVDIPGLPIGLARELKDRILEQRRTVAEHAQPQGSEEALAPDYQLHLPWREVALYGLMFNGLIFLAPAMAPFVENLAPSAEQWLAGLEGTGLHRAAERLGEGALAWLVAALTLIAVLFSMAAIFAASVLIALWRFWDYHLTRTGDQYQYRAGFGTVKTRGFRAHKLQLVTVSQGLVARLLKRYTLAISKAGAMAGRGETQDTRRFLVPVVDVAGLADLKRQLGIPAAAWHRVSPVYMVLRCLFLSTLMAIFLLWFFLDHALIGFYILLGCLLILLYAWRSWRRLGVCISGEWLAVRRGFVGHKQQWMPLAKMQKVSVSEPPWLKPWALATVTVWSADGRLHVPCIPRHWAKALRDQTLFRVVTFRGSWF